jgi:hypothetical protein
MSAVVERGSARCPRCVAVADYAFIEGEFDVFRYEVHCRSCGEVYSEVNSLAPAAASIERALPALPIPPEPREPGTWRSHLTPIGRAATRLRDRAMGLDLAGLIVAKTPTASEPGANG